MSDLETLYALRSYGDTRVLELERAAEAFCGWDARHDAAKAGVAFEAIADRLLGGPVALRPCEHFHGGAGEVQRFTNVCP